jgi:hypothetical protein
VIQARRKGEGVDNTAEAEVVGSFTADRRDPAARRSAATLAASK